MKPLALLPGMFVVAPATTAGPVAGAIIAEINGSEPTLFTEVSRSEAPPAFTPASKPVQLHTGAAGGGGALSGISAAEAAPNAPNEIAEAIAHPRKRFIKNPQSKINLRQVSAYPRLSQAAPTRSDSFCLVLWRLCHRTAAGGEPQTHTRASGLPRGIFRFSGFILRDSAKMPLLQR